MKVRVALSIDVDREKWADMWGIPMTSKAVSDDVRRYVLNAVRMLDSIESLGADVELTR